jgi:hypothetical protein
MDNNKDSALLLKQYEFLSNIRTQLDHCLKSIEQNNQRNLTVDLETLNNLMKPMSYLFAQKHKVISLFSTQPILPPEINQMIKEADEILTLQKKLLGIHHRTP